MTKNKREKIYEYNPDSKVIDGDMQMKTHKSLVGQTMGEY